MTILYFGKPWDAPILDHVPPSHRFPTPIGKPCLRCGNPIQEGERGLMMQDPIATNPNLVPIHIECEMIGIIGHLYGVCTCTGYDTASREAALELLRRMNEARARQGLGPL